MSYRNLEIWQMARTLVVDEHQMTLKKLPKFEMFEDGKAGVYQVFDILTGLVRSLGDIVRDGVIGGPKDV